MDNNWTIISALNEVLDKAHGSSLSEAFWNDCHSPLAYLRQQLGLTDMQLVTLAILIEMGEAVSWHSLGKFLRCSRLSLMVYSEEIEDLVTRRWCVHHQVREMGGNCTGFLLAPGVIKALRHNQAFTPEKIDGLSIQEFVNKLERHVGHNERSHSAIFEDDEMWFQQLTEANLHLALCQEAHTQLPDIHALAIFMLILADYAAWANSGNEGVLLEYVSEHFSNEDFLADILEEELRSGSHVLIKNGFIEHKCEDGIANNECYCLTRRVKDELLAGYTPRKPKVNFNATPDDKNLRKHASIKEKNLYYNASEQQQISRLTTLLQEDNLKGIQQRLEQQGLRKGFACLFYGAPGTGKTETVLQIARQTGRDIMQVDIAGMRDKYVGESEKNIKQVFSRYRDLCKESSVMPILFFNEADALINKRSEHIEHSVDKMDNAMQNIILQELEDLEGILIATTNLTGNLDNAFERRFLYKVEFHKPEVSVKARIWTSMLTSISTDEAEQLAKRFDFSGGQIENVARKRTIDYILTGEEPSLHQIEDYCRAELLDHGTAHRSVIGFVA